VVGLGGPASSVESLSERIISIGVDSSCGAPIDRLVPPAVAFAFVNAAVPKSASEVSAH
jgi:hypothetical protein